VFRIATAVRLAIALGFLSAYARPPFGGLGQVPVFCRRDLEPVTGIKVRENVPAWIGSVVNCDLEHLALIVVIFLGFERVVLVVDRFAQFPGVVLKKLNFPIHLSKGFGMRRRAV
jgi:hypothetical protein